MFLWLGAGVLFAILWASASTATKIALNTAQPLVIAEVRFGIAAGIMLLWSHLIRRNRLPHGKEWKQLSIYGLFNITIYLGLYVVAMQTVTAGIGALAVATNPVMITFLSFFFSKKKLTLSVLSAIIFGVLGVIIAAWPLFTEATVTTEGLLILLLSMLSYSVGAIYFSVKNWHGLTLFTINGWQTLIGGLLLLPVAALYYDPSMNLLNTAFWGV